MVAHTLTRVHVFDDVHLAVTLAAAGRDFAPLSRIQLERMGYFAVDPATTDGALVLNRTIALKDSWAKVAGKG